MLTRRTPRPRIALPRGERLLAWASLPGGHIGGTREALYLSRGEEVIRLPWQRVHSAVWDPETDVLRVDEVGEWGADRPVHELRVSHPSRLLPMVRERVTASILLQRQVTIEGRRGLRVIARRPPTGSGEVVWFYEYDEGIDPDDDRVRTAARQTLAAAREELGLT
ncbi:MAG: hypothetical protein ACRCYQ_04310 [Nocardioides sp.]